MPKLPALPALPTFHPSMPHLSSVPLVVWLAISVVMLPFVIVLGALAIKLLWGFWPVPAGIIAAGWAVWHAGLEFFWLIALGIGFGIVVTWLWQRTRLFLAGDRLLERGMFLGD